MIRQADDAWLRRRQAREAAAFRKAELQAKGERAKLVRILAKLTMVRVETRKVQVRLADRAKAEEEMGGVFMELHRGLGQAASDGDGRRRELITSIQRDLSDLMAKGSKVTPENDAGPSW